MPRFLPNPLLFLLLVILALLGQAGCGSNSDPESAKTQALADNLSSQIRSLNKLLMEPVSRKDPQAAQAVLADFFRKASQAGKPLPNGVMILDINGVTFAERNPAPGHPSGVSSVGAAKDYSSYHVVSQALEHGSTELGVVYLNQDKLYVVCHPLGKRKPVGVLCLGILGSYLEGKIGVSGQQFLAMKISP
jgi:hypothetical protein